MAGFKAAEEVEPLDYDFNPHAPVSGTIPEPTSDQVAAYQSGMANALKGTGIDPEQIRSGEVKLDQLDELLQTVKSLELGMVNATADLTQIPVSTLSALPYRVKAAFLGWIMGEFFNPQR